ncbi:AAA family ATPase [Acidianus brierleyi]|uniref:AAA family ATPase n=1 Tax=Acidianus brierleyi TaxID=41673 RepID=UPI00248452D9|nr:ATP-binding protein [Acidianus brierleyi]
MKPKEDPKDLFDREEELQKLKNGINYPVSLLLGLRRSGKSSLVKVLMKEEDAIWIYLDLRKYETKTFITYKDVIIELEKALNRFPQRIKKLLEGIKGINVAGLEIKLNWGKQKVEISEIFDKLSEISEKEDKKVIIVFDESQELRKLKGYNLLNPLAYAYDNLKIRFLFTGSEIGMVYRFLKIKDPNSPLFGRAMTEITIHPFTKEKAIEFLKKGFEEVKINLDEKLLEDVYNNIGGIPGWLTYYGFNYIQEKDHEEALNKTIELAVSLIKKEFRNFLKGREEAKERYYTIMGVCKKGCRWSESKRAIEAKEGVRIDDKKLTELLQNLIDASFLIKENEIYRPADILIEKAF